MGIGRNLETALLKAIRSLDIKVYGIVLKELEKLSDAELKTAFLQPDDRQLFVLAEALKRGWVIEELADKTNWNPFFLIILKRLVEFTEFFGSTPWDKEGLIKAKRLGFADTEIASLWNSTEDEIFKFRREHKIFPVFKMVDTCAGEFEATTPYFYSSYDDEDEGEVHKLPKVVVLGSGPIRIGQGIEFDYCSVHAVLALRRRGFESIIVNNNPETVSTDFDTADRLYFEPLTLEDVSAILDKEQPDGVIVQFGGQTAIGLASSLERRGYPILGTTVENIDRAEERGTFDRVLQELGAKRPRGDGATTMEQVRQVAQAIGFPLVVRPSYVLGGRAMEIVYEEKELELVAKRALSASSDQEIWMDQYLLGKEVEVDAISDGENVFIPGIMEHLERAGVHSGDSIAVYPPQSLEPDMQERIIALTESLARSLQIKGLLNIQYVIYRKELYVLEVNPRSSRTVPFLSKVTGVPIVDWGTQVILGRSWEEIGIPYGIWPTKNRVAVKAPVFSFSKLQRVEPSLGPEMKSTGEVMGMDRTYEKALYKALLGAGLSLTTYGSVLVTLADRDKAEGVDLVRRFVELGFRILATAGTANYLKNEGIRVEPIAKLHDGSNEIIDGIRKQKIQYVVNSTTHGRVQESDGFAIRRAAVEYGIPCFTSLDTAAALLHVLESISPGLLPL